jgi:hypothetical protein
VADDPRRNKYARNRHLWRRVYPGRRRRPASRVFIDASTETTYSLDLNKTYRHRDFFIIKSQPSGVIPAEVVAQYQEGLVFFNNTTYESAGFDFCFDDTPDAVVLTVEPAAHFSDNIIPYGLIFNSCSMSIGVSAPFSGAIRYRAAYSELGYPASATSSFAPGSGSFTIFAGHITASNVDTVSASYNLGNIAPNGLRLTTWDFFTNFDVDVDIVKTNVGITGSDLCLSAPLNNTIYFIAFR